MALGARREKVVLMVLREVLVLAVLGLAIGAPLALGISRVVESFLFGLKPTEHRVSIAGHIPDLPGAPRSVRIMGVVGPHARDVADLALAFRIIAGADGHDIEVPPVPVSERPAPALRDLRIAWVPTFPGVPVAQDIRHSIERLASELSRLGAAVEEKLPPVDFLAQRQLFSDLVETVIRVFNPAATAPFADLADYLRALDRRDRYIRDWDAFLTRWDVLLYPPAMITAFEHCETGAALEVDGVPVRYWELLSHCCPFNLTGHPAVVMPIGLDRRGLPIGAQLVGQRWGDERLLAIAGAISKVAGGFQRPPDLSAT
jgi:amidase